MSAHPTVVYFIPSLLPLIQELRIDRVESCFFCSIDNQLRVINTKKFCSNGVSEVTLNMHAITSLIQSETRYAVIIHNHPSGKTYPSKADFISTERLIQLGELLNFKILDHLIVTSKNYFSFSESGILEDIRSPSA